MIRKVLAVFATALVAVALTAVPVSASTDPIKGTQHHVTYWINHETGAELDWWLPGGTPTGEAYINHFHKGASGRYTSVNDVYRDAPQPTLTRKQARELREEMIAAGISMNLPSWANPLGWDWLGMIGWVWTTIIDKCLTGALQGVVGTASGTLIVNLMMRGAKLYVGPWGYAALAIGGCTVGLIS